MFAKSGRRAKVGDSGVRIVSPTGRFREGSEKFPRGGDGVRIVSPRSVAGYASRGALPRCCLRLASGEGGETGRGVSARARGVGGGREGGGWRFCGLAVELSPSGSWREPVVAPHRERSANHAAEDRHLGCGGVQARRSEGTAGGAAEGGSCGAKRAHGGRAAAAGRHVGRGTPPARTRPTRTPSE